MDKEREVRPEKRAEKRRISEKETDRQSKVKIQGKITEEPKWLTQTWANVHWLGDFEKRWRKYHQIKRGK